MRTRAVEHLARKQRVAEESVSKMLPVWNARSLFTSRDMPSGLQIMFYNAASEECPLIVYK